jgi:hypothetical protein
MRPTGGVQADVRIGANPVGFADVEHPLLVDPAVYLFAYLTKIKVGLPMQFFELVCHVMGILWGKVILTRFFESCKSFIINGAPNRS